MAATVYLCERNGANATNTVNSMGICYKNSDNSNINYLLPDDALYGNTYSYEKYNYLQFVGSYNSIGNIRLTLVSSLPSYLQLYISNSAYSYNDCVSYVQPVNTPSTVATNLLSTNNVINLLASNIPSSDAASPSHKSIIVGTGPAVVSTNYFVTQLRILPNAPTGTVPPIVFNISYDEN